MSESAENQRLTVEIARQYVQQEKTLEKGGEVAFEQRISLESFTEMESGVAMILARSGLSSIDMRNLRSLTLDDALALKTYGGELYLNGLESLEAEVEKVVAKFKAYSLEAFRLKQIQTKALARRITDEGSIILYDCDISEKAAAVFAETRASLMLGRLDRLSPKVRRILAEGGCEIVSTKTGVIQKEDVHGFGVFNAGLAGKLAFSEATGISPEAAEELGGYPGEKIRFDKPITITAKAATGISRFRGRLKLCRLNQLSDKAATILASMTVEVSRYSTRAAALPHVAMSKHGIVVVKDKNITVESISEVLKASHLVFSHLAVISAPVAEILAKIHHGTLTFSAVQSISPDVAEALSRHQGGIAFDGFERLTSRIASKLSALNGFLAFRGLRSLSASAAQELAKHRGRLNLDGLKSLPSSTASGLKKHGGDLSLPGLKTLSVKAAEILTKKPGKKILPNLQSLDAMHVLLQKDSGRVVVPYDLDAEGNFD